ncbi:MAG: hypothetical protein M1825_003849 [Sarcosagium campestre]|nr:MAG: hypothetical protein M1825_003849 [Sarcosagium campestre]
MSSPDKSYLAAGLGGLTPWGSRTATPRPSASDAVSGKQRGGDHAVKWKNRLNSKLYPPDCPALRARWFYAVDAPKKKPQLLEQSNNAAVPLPKPNKFLPFSTKDSRMIEAAFQRLADEEEYKAAADGKDESENLLDVTSAVKRRTDSPASQEGKATLQSSTTVPVNEDYLFDVDIEKRELAPAYWLGPIYDVRRGTWFYQEGANLRPCDENLATQLEEGYLKVKPFRFPPRGLNSKSQSRPTSLTPAEADDFKSALTTVVARPTSAKGDESKPTPAGEAPVPGRTSPVPEQQNQVQTHRLFGNYMNSVVTYQDSTNAWITTDDLMSRVSSTVYQRFAGGGYLGGVRVVRGYRDAAKTAQSKSNVKSDEKPNVSKDAIVTDKQGGDETFKTEKSNARDASPDDTVAKNAESEIEDSTARLVGDVTPNKAISEEEEARRRDEQEMQDDYRDQDGAQDREIDHLILVTHGIGQKLGLRMESVNFVHDVNILRKTIKGVYATSAELQALNAEVDKLPKNCRVQVLPVRWRHLLDFPKQGVRQSRKEQDVADADVSLDEEQYPSLEDITVEGVPAVRQLISDIGIDLLLYQSPYREHISGIVLRECNRVYQLFVERNPRFNGRVSLVGHSLGSAIFFDILCRQKEPLQPRQSVVNRPGHGRSPSGVNEDSKKKDTELDFAVDSLFCLGSPIGLFQMLKGRTIAGRHPVEAPPSESPLDPESMHDPFLASPNVGSANTGDLGSAASQGQAREAGYTVTVSSPKCAQLFNIFHPTDPIAYRLEPLITPSMSSMRPQPLPYTKRGIFGAPVGQGITGIGAKVGQSVSGMWSNFSSGIASSILNRSLGLGGADDVLTSGTAARTTQQKGTEEAARSIGPSAGAGTSLVDGGTAKGVAVTAAAAAAAAATASEDKKRKLVKDTLRADETGSSVPTLLDSEIETLYSGFQKRRKSHQSDDGGEFGQNAEWQEIEEKGRKLRREEEKVRRLNTNGRVDYSIQEGAFDISMIASIASHLSYWGDQDVSHFIVSQLLARHRAKSRVE